MNAGLDIDTPTPATGSRVASLVVTRGPDPGQRWALRADRAMALGRHPDCDVVLAHLSVSRKHAEIRSAAGGFALADTGSLVGTYLNGVPVDSVPLADGDEIAIGVFRLVFVAEAEGTV